MVGSPTESVCASAVEGCGAHTEGPEAGEAQSRAHLTYYLAWVATITVFGSIVGRLCGALWVWHDIAWGDPVPDVFNFSGNRPWFIPWHAAHVCVCVCVRACVVE